MKVYSVNEVLNDKSALHGQRIYIEEVLTFETENITLLHWPLSERGQSSIWLEESGGPLRFNRVGMEKLVEKKVIALGELQSKLPPEHENFYHGFGHFGMWSAQLVVTEIQYYKRWHEANGSTQT